MEAQGWKRTDHSFREAQTQAVAPQQRHRQGVLNTCPAKPSLRPAQSKSWGRELHATVFFLIYKQDIELLSKGMNVTAYRNSRADPNQEGEKTLYILFRFGVNDYLSPKTFIEPILNSNGDDPTGRWTQRWTTFFLSLCFHIPLGAILTDADPAPKLQELGKFSQIWKAPKERTGDYGAILFSNQLQGFRWDSLISRKGNYYADFGFALWWHASLGKSLIMVAPFFWQLCKDSRINIRRYF